MSVLNDSDSEPDQTPSIRQVEGLELPIPPAVPIPSIENPEGATFVVHPRHEHEEPIVFHRSEELPPTSPVEPFSTAQADFSSTDTARKLNICMM